MRLIINADDFGWDVPANKAILDLCERGKLNGVSIMANHVAGDWLAKLRSYQPFVRLGIHVVLNDGSPLTEPSQIGSLLDKEGRFFSSNELWQRYLLGRIRKEHIGKEVQTQVQFLRAHGIRVAHADSHQHIHQFPGLGAVIQSSLWASGIASIRHSLPVERHDLRRIVLATFAKWNVGRIAAFDHNDLLVTYLASQPYLDTQVLEELLGRLSAHGIRLVELMCHPATADRAGSYLKRKQEWEFLKKWTFGQSIF